MRKLLIFCAAVLVAASCSSFDSGRYGNTHTQTPGNGSGNGNGNGEDPGTTPGSSVNPFSDDLRGWRCVSYSMGKKTFDQTLEFHYDENGYLEYYLEHTLSYENDGVKVWSDDNYKRIYYRTSPTHIDYYEDRVEGNKRSSWFNFDSQGRITEKYNPYGDSYRYHYDEKGRLIEIENDFQFKDEADEQEYGSWKKSRVVDWLDEQGRPVYFAQKWTSGTQTIYRDEKTILSNTAYTNPFRNMAIDPTVQEMAINPLVSSKGIFDMEGWWGARSKYLITGWYSQDNSSLRTDVDLITDREDHITGMVREISNGGLDTRREYTFVWKGEAHLLKKDGIPVIN